MANLLLFLGPTSRELSREAEHPGHEPAPMLDPGDAIPLCHSTGPREGLHDSHHSFLKSSVVGVRNSGLIDGLSFQVRERLNFLVVTS